MHLDAGELLVEGPGKGLQRGQPLRCIDAVLLQLAPTALGIAAAEGNQQTVSQDIQTKLGDMDKGVDHHLNEIVVAFDLVQNGGKDHEGVGMTDLGQLPARLLDIVLAQTLEGVANFDTGLNLRLDYREGLGPWRGSRGTLLQSGQAGGSVQTVSDLVRQLGQDRPQFHAYGHVGGEERHARDEEGAKEGISSFVDLSFWYHGFDQPTEHTVQGRVLADGARCEDDRQRSGKDRRQLFQAGRWRYDRLGGNGCGKQRIPTNILASLVLLRCGSA